ncbi:hypothetical protein [Saccharothrix sp. NRRL B-16314]|uniref:hypothetical protein n=1 Tax=Saccharothrix sp. NRRL B-16314 TaxID=1463825 RepID=UPI0012DC1D3F|nr:hypothetical protein [Saccharothrix sp. NRRL B-16314]
MRFPRFRVFTWIILAINALFLVWIIGGVSGRPDAQCDSLDQGTCQAASDVGTGLSVLVIIFLWVAADVILGVLWLITRRKTRDCPACGRSVKRGMTVCRGCGYDFAQASQAMRAQSYPPNPA